MNMIGCKLQAMYGRLCFMMCHMSLGPTQSGLYDNTVKEEGACFMPRLIKFLKPAYLKPIALVFSVIFPFQVGVGVAAPTDLVFAESPGDACGAPQWLHQRGSRGTWHMTQPKKTRNNNSNQESTINNQHSLINKQNGSNRSKLCYCRAGNVEF